MADCNKCPLSEVCLKAFFDVFGAVLGDVGGVESYEECDYFKSCRDDPNPYGCLKTIFESEYATIYESLDFEDEEEW